MLVNADMGEDLPPNIESPDYWCQRAEEARALSEQMRDSKTKALMVEIAETYGRIAKAYETNVLIDENSERTKRSC